MKIQKKFHSEHVEELKKEIKLKFKQELSGSRNSLLKGQILEVLECLESAVLPVDHLRSPEFNFRLDKSKNFYGLKLDAFTQTAHLHSAYNQNIRKSLQISMQMMNKKDMWKFFLSSTLMELQQDEKVDLMLRVGSDHKFPTDKESNDTADFIIAGPKTKVDFPLLIADIKCEAAEGRSGFNPKKLQNMMTTTLVDMFNTRKHWPLTEMVQLCVYGLIVRDEEFYISRMALRPERGTKLAFVYTSGKRSLPRNLFIKPKTKTNTAVYERTFNQEVYAQMARGDADSTEEEYESESDEWTTCVLCQTCHYRGEKHLFEQEFEDLCLEQEQKNNPQPAPKVERNNGAKVYRRPHGGSVTAIVALLQTVQAKYKLFMEKDKQYKHLKTN